jgi:hypothetical protein
VADARKQTAAATAGRRSPLASRPCTRSCSPPLPASGCAGAARLTGAADAVQVDGSLTDLAALAEDLERDGDAVLARLAKPLPM